MNLGKTRWFPNGAALSANPSVPVFTSHAAEPSPVIYVDDVDGEHDIYSIYLREIRRVPLLRPGQEQELAARVKMGDKAARDQMITANLRLVVKIAHDYSGFGVPLLDLINEGNIGLMKAVERYDPAKGAKLSVYAAFWIKQAIRRALANQGKTIRLPVHLVDHLARLQRAALKLQGELGREPSDEEIGCEINLPTLKVTFLRQASVRPCSLDAQIGEDSDETMGTVIPDENCKSPAQQLEGSSQSESLAEAFEELTERERTVLVRRFGLETGTECTLLEIGDEMGLTHERIRQIQNMALAKLRRWLEKHDMPAPVALKLLGT
jgi:RNA polymerase primary sigma factor